MEKACQHTNRELATHAAITREQVPNTSPAQQRINAAYRRAKGGSECELAAQRNEGEDGAQEHRDIEQGACGKQSRMTGVNSQLIGTAT